MKSRVYGLLVGVLVLTGCSTTSMKGSPFYTAEYEQREGLDPGRVNLGVIYYREPVLHVLWPLMEFGPKYLAVRPVYSVYDRETDHPVYNVLWPIARFDTGNKDYRIFPVYWGDEYFNIVPLYWHNGDPFTGVGYNALLPFWIWNRTAEGSSLDLFWPLYSKKEFPNHQAWRLWPLYGVSKQDDRYHRYIAWPFIYGYASSQRAGHTVIPFYWYEKNDDRTRFVSLPYSRSIAANPGDKSWDLTLPLCYRRWQGDSLYWEVYPILSWGTRDGDKSNSFYALGLGRRLKSADRSSSHVIPFYYYNKDQHSQSFHTLPWWSKKYTDGTGWHTLVPVYFRGRYENASAFYTLPWWSKTYDDGTGFHSLIPIYYRSRNENMSSFYSLPWWSKSYADGSGWHSLFPLFFRSSTDDGSAFYSLPWLSRKEADGSGWHTSIPFYYHSYADDASRFYSLPWLSEKHADGSEWQASFPFYFRSASSEGSLMLTPFYARKQHGDGSTAWQSIIPLVYLDETYDAHFLTLLGGRWRMGDEYNWLALPLLSGGARDADSGRNIWLAGLAGQRWEDEDSAHYVFPFYYAALSKGQFYSLPYAAWRKDGKQHHAVPWLVSGWYSGADASGSLLLAGLAGHRKGSEKDYHYVFPFYYAAPGSDTFLSLPYAAWNGGGRKNHVIPPLLSGWYSEGDASGSVIALGLAGHRRGDEHAYSYVIPFYYAAPHKGTFISLPYAAWRNGDQYNQVIPLLLSGRRVTGDRSATVLLGGLGYWATGQGEMQGSHVLPFYLWSRENYFYTLLFGKNRKLSYYATPLAGRFGGEAGGSGSWVAPFYWHRQKPTGEVNGHYLLLGYYHENRNRCRYGVYGLYDYNHWKLYTQGGAGDSLAREGKKTDYLFFLGQSKEQWDYEPAAKAGSEKLKTYRKDQYLFPLWNRNIIERISMGDRLETSSLLGILYDTRHEQKTGKEKQDYLRRRVLWRLYHYEKLNGDVSVDVFPAITIDSYKNGYHKTSFLWRMFRYEKDPESGRTKLDLLFIPLKR